MKSDDELAWFESLEKLEVAHGKYGARLAEVDDGVAKASAFADHFEGELSLAGEVLGAFEVQSFYGEWVVRVVAVVGTRGPNFDDAAQFCGGSGHFLGEGRDAALGGSELVREDQDRSSSGIFHYGASRAEAVDSNAADRSLSNFANQHKNVFWRHCSLFRLSHFVPQVALLYL